MNNCPKDKYGNKLFKGAKISYYHSTSIKRLQGYVKVLGNHSAFVKPVESTSDNPAFRHIVLFKESILNELEDRV